MNPLAIIGMLSPKAWAAVGVGLLLLALGVQSARLSHAKADQLDRSACVAGQPCRPVKWKDEAKAAEGMLGKARSDLGTCQTNAGALTAALDAQSAAAARMKADDAARDAATRQGLAAEQAKTRSLAGKIASLQAERAKPGETPERACGRILLDGVGDEP